jgi:hypothetical protein
MVARFSEPMVMNDTFQYLAKKTAATNLGTVAFYKPAMKAVFSPKGRDTS